jgi:hypothetical protein
MKQGKIKCSVDNIEQDTTSRTDFKAIGTIYKNPWNRKTTIQLRI